MQTRAYGQTGLQVPVLGFGAMQIGDPGIDEASAARLLNHVLDSGVTLIDTARSYGVAEQRIGRHLSHRRGEFVLSTKVGYGVDGVPDWTYDCIVQGVDAARARLRTDVIDIVHLHSCGLETLRRGEVAQALAHCVDSGKVRVAAYSGDAEPLAYALDSGCFRGLQASVNLCDQQALPVLQRAQQQGLGTIAKRSLAGRPWRGNDGGDPVHDAYRARFELLRHALDCDAGDWDAIAVRFAAYAPGVDCVIVGGTDAANLDRNVAAVNRGPLEPDRRSRIMAAFATHGLAWPGLV